MVPSPKTESIGYTGHDLGLFGGPGTIQGFSRRELQVGSSEEASPWKGYVSRQGHGPGFYTRVYVAYERPPLVTPLLSWP